MIIAVMDEPLMPTSQDRSDSENEHSRFQVNRVRSEELTNRGSKDMNCIVDIKENELKEEEEEEDSIDFTDKRSQTETWKQFFSSKFFFPLN